MKKFLLKKKIVLLLLSISLISLVVAGIIIYFSVGSVLMKNKKEEIISITSEQTHESILNFKNNQLFVYILGVGAGVKEFLLDHSEQRKTELLNIFLELTNKDKNYLAISLLDKNGVGLISTDSHFKGQDYSSRDYFKKAIKGESAMDFAFDKISNQIIYYFAEPVLGTNNEVIGVMVVKVDENDINDPVYSNSEAKDNTIMLVDEFGVILYSNESDRKLKSLGELSENEKYILKNNQRFLDLEIIPLQYGLVEQGIRDYKNPIAINFKDIEDDDDEIISIIKLDGLPFYLVTEIRLNELNNQIINTIYIILMVILIVFIFLSLSVYYFLAIFIKPLEKFKLFFASIGKGDFSQEIKIETRDEFYDMALSVNKMAHDLSDFYKNLEGKVKERTKELEESEEKLQDNLFLLEKNNKMMINRELEMIKLKEHIKELENSSTGK